MTTANGAVNGEELGAGVVDDGAWGGAALSARLPVPDHDLARLADRLAEQATEESLVDVVYRTLDSPVGPLLLAVTERGVVRIAFERQGFDEALDELGERIGPRVLTSSVRTDPVARQLDEYFAGGRRTFDLPVDHRLAHGFRARVQAALPDIAYGTTTSYGALARVVGRPGAARAVGTACATNPVPIVVPCHRVLRADGSAGGYAGGEAAKRLLLALERAS